MSKPMDEVLNFQEACDRVRQALERIPPSHFRHEPGTRVDPFSTRMAAAGYRALAAELDAVAKAHEQE